MTSSQRRYPIVDVHVHVYLDAVKPFLQIMDTAGLSRVVNLGVIERQKLPYAQGLAAYREHLGKRMVHFATPDFDDVAPGFGDRMARALQRKVEAGACGLKIFKDLGLRHRDRAGKLIPVNDPRLDPLWAKAGELSVPVLIHTADPVAFFQPLDRSNERWEELQAHPDWHFGRPEFPPHDTLLEQRNQIVASHPDTIFIGAHLGNYPEDLAYVDACLEHYPNLFLDTSARIGEIGRHPVEEVRAFFTKHQDRILFGSDLVIGRHGFDPDKQLDIAMYRRRFDAHWQFFETDTRQFSYPGYPLQGRWKVDGVQLAPDVLEKLYFRNAERLIPAL